MPGWPARSCSATTALELELELDDLVYSAVSAASRRLGVIPGSPWCGYGCGRGASSAGGWTSIFLTVTQATSAMNTISAIPAMVPSPRLRPPLVFLLKPSANEAPSGRVRM